MRHSLSVVIALIVSLCVFGRVQAQTATPTMVMMGPGWYEESAGQVVFSGTGWTNVAEGTASGGYIKYTASSDASISFDFLGSGFAAYFCRSNVRGNVQVCIDGDCYTESHYNTTYYCRWSRTFDNLDYGLHSVSITKITGSYLDLDAVHVWGWEAPNIEVNVGEISVMLPTSEVVVVGTLSNGLTYTVDRSASFGDGAIVVSLSLLAVVGVIGIVMRIIYGRPQR